MADTDYYSRNLTDYTLGEGQHDVRIAEPKVNPTTKAVSNTYTVSGPSKGVDVVATLRYSGLGPGEAMEAQWVIYDNDEKDGTEHEVRHARQGTTLGGAASASQAVGRSVPFKGTVPKPKVAGHRTMLRLRLTVPAGRKVTIHAAELSGWVLPA